MSLGLVVVTLGLIAPAPLSAQVSAVDTGPTTGRVLAELRDSADLRAQRQHAWWLLRQLSQIDRGEPRFESWYGESALFGHSAVRARGMRGFAPRVTATSSAADVPVISYTLYNEAAYAHIRRWGLNRLSELKRLQAQGPEDSSFSDDRAVPTFPATSMVLKTVWWPVAHDAVTALPVWDPQDNPPRSSGNGYTTWRRVVAVVPSVRALRSTAPVSFIGQTFPQARSIGLDAFYYLQVDGSLAQRLMADSEAQRTILMALGRPIEAGDYLLLVGANLATKEIPDWVWVAFWWSDQSKGSPFAMDRPPGLGPAWSHYMMQVAFDAERPTEANGQAHICFNPWLEGRFPDGGHGSGAVSNCQACHRRASFPAIGFLPVTRGNAQRSDDPAYAPGRLRTGFLWSLALHAR